MTTCPHGHGNLNKINKQGIEIEYCPVCGGVWLDRGELENLIDLASRASASAQNMAPNLDFDKPKQTDNFSQNRDSQPYNKDFKKKKKEGFLGEIFDFDLF
jgi:Zn-finger nucleic acid-binding protein